jgi:hypothetical protein
MRRRGLRCLWGCGARLVRVPTLAEKWSGLTLFGVLVGNPQVTRVVMDVEGGGGRGEGGT